MSACSEVDIINQLARDEIKSTPILIESTIDVNKLPQIIAKLEATPEKLINEFKENPKTLRDILTVAHSTHIKNSQLHRQNSDLQSQKLQLLELANKISKDNDKLVETIRTLEDINDTNYESLCKYKDMYDNYQTTLESILQHGITNIEPDLVSSIHVKDTTYPICIVYLKQITHLSYLSTYLDSLLNIMVDKHKIAKVLRILPRNSTKKLVKYKDYFNTTNGLNALTYSTYSRFVHLGNPHTILEYMVSNQIPIDVLFIVDETGIDNQYCYGKSVIRYNLANKDTDILEYDLDTKHSIVNHNYGGTKTNLLPYYPDFSKIKDSNKLVQVYNESLPLTSVLVNHIEEVLASIEEGLNE